MEDEKFRCRIWLQNKSKIEFIPNILQPAAEFKVPNAPNWEDILSAMQENFHIYTDRWLSWKFV